jgi:hypothetical protein
MWLENNALSSQMGEKEEILKFQNTGIDLDDCADRRGHLIQNILLIYAKQHGVICKQDRQCAYNVKLKRVLATIFAVEK